MLVDDNEVDLKINSKIISISKIFDDIIICHSAEEGLSYLRRNSGDASLLPNLILLDIQMPEMDGFEFLERFKVLPQSVISKCNIAILSSTLDFGDIKKAEASPHVMRLLKKPLQIKEIKELLNL